MNFNLEGQYPDQSATLNADDADRIRRTTGDVMLRIIAGQFRKTPGLTQAVKESRMESAFNALYSRDMCTKNALAVAMRTLREIESMPQADPVATLVSENETLFRQSLRKTPSENKPTLELVGRVVAESMAKVANITEGMFK